MTDAFAARLGNCLHLGSPAQRIEQGGSGATVRYREFGKEQTTLLAAFRRWCSGRSR